MNDSLSLRQPGGVADKFRPAGKFHIEHIRDGNLLAVYDIPNGITDVGLNHILESEFHAGTQITTWNVGLVDNAGFSAFAAGDTMASHAGWAETSGYSNGTRPQWTCGAAATRQITNAATVDFNINATVTIKGLFIVGGTGASSKGGATGTLWSAAAFGSTIPVTSGDVLKVTYTLSG